MGIAGIGEAFALKPLLQLNDVIDIRLASHIGNFGIDDERAVKPQRLLSVDVRVRVVEVGAGLLSRKFIR